jgi:rhodanese-related sulfurtransferase
MATAGPSVDQAHLARFSPLDTLHPDLLEELRGHARIERFPPGKWLLGGEARRGEAMFLLSGQLALVVDGKVVMTLRADSVEARRPVSHEATPRMTALARTSVTVLFVDAVALEGLLERSTLRAPPAIGEAGQRPDEASRPATATHGSVLLDVRSPRAYARRHLEGSVNFPLRVLRHAVFLLDRSRAYLVCGDGRRAATAVALLSRHGLHAAMLSGGHPAGPGRPANP